MRYTEIGKTGLKISNLSFGASSLGSVFHATNEADSIKAVEVAIEGGINFIDVSPYYGHYKAETVLGKALKFIPRDKYFLSTKAARYCEDKGYPIEKLAIQFSVSNPRIAGTLFSSANPVNVKRNIDWANEEPDWELVSEVQQIIGDQCRVSWANT